MEMTQALHAYANSMNRHEFIAVPKRQMNYLLAVVRPTLRSRGPVRSRSLAGASLYRTSSSFGPVDQPSCKHRTFRQFHRWFDNASLLPRSDST